MPSLITEGLNSSFQHSLITQGLTFSGATPPTPVTLTDPYIANYEGIVLIIEDKLITNANPPRKPYEDSWRGIINAVKDSKGTGTLRVKPYEDSFLGFMEVMWDKYSAPSESGFRVQDVYSITFEGIVQLLIYLLEPDGTHKPYLDNFEGIVNVIRDSTV